MIECGTVVIGNCDRGDTDEAARGERGWNLGEAIVAKAYISAFRRALPPPPLGLRPK